MFVFEFIGLNFEKQTKSRSKALDFLFQKVHLFANIKFLVRNSFFLWGLFVMVKVHFLVALCPNVSVQTSWNIFFSSSRVRFDIAFHISGSRQQTKTTQNRTTVHIAAHWKPHSACACQGEGADPEPDQPRCTHEIVKLPELKTWDCPIVTPQPGFNALCVFGVGFFEALLIY